MVFARLKFPQRDGNIALYLANSDGTKADFLCEVNDPSIIKSDLNTNCYTNAWGLRKRSN